MAILAKGIEMFKSKEELIKEYAELIKEYVSEEYHLSESDRKYFNRGYKDGIDDAFKSIAERIDTYRKYRFRPNDFASDYPKEYEDYADEETKHKTNWCDWLFNLCFDGVK